MSQNITPFMIHLMTCNHTICRESGPHHDAPTSTRHCGQCVTGTTHATLFFKTGSCEFLPRISIFVSTFVPKDNRFYTVAKEFACLVVMGMCIIQLISHCCLCKWWFCFEVFSGNSCFVSCLSHHCEILLAAPVREKSVEVSTASCSDRNDNGVFS